MFEFLPIFLVTLALLLVLALGLAFGRAPTYRPERESVRELLVSVVEKRAQSGAWELFLGLPIVHDPELEKIRRRCLAVHEGDDEHPPARAGLGDAIYDRAGRERLAQVLTELEHLIAETPVYREF